MKHPSENNLNVFASLLLGGIGANLLLVPAHLQISITNPVNWVFILLGGACFAAALSLQIVSVMRVSQKRVRLVQGLSILLLIVLARVYQQNEYFMEGAILLFTGVMQLAFILSPVNRFKHVDLLNLTFSLIGFSVGIHLAVSTIGLEQVPLAAYVPYLSIGFLLFAFIGASITIVPSVRYGKTLLRLQALPWAAWCFVFIPSDYGANLIAPLAVIVMVLLNDFLPWNRLRLPEGDILGRRAIMVATTIEVALLVFLSFLLFAAENLLVDEAPAIQAARQATFLFFTFVTSVIYYEVITIVMTVNGLMQELTDTGEEVEKTAGSEESGHPSPWSARLARYLKPFTMTREGIRIRLIAQEDQIEALERQLTNEKKRNAQLTLLMELSQQLENQLDQPVSAQLAVNTLERALNCSLACIYVHEPEKKEFMLLTAAGNQTGLIPAGYRQKASDGMIGRAFRQRKTQIVNDIKLDADYILFKGENNRSAVVIPLIFNGHVNGAIVLNKEDPNAFSSIDIGLAEAAAAELTRAWERSGYQQRLMDLIQAGSQLSSMVEPESTAQEVASIAREILRARFTYVHIQLGQERNFTQSSSSGNAPHLMESLERSTNSAALLAMALHAAKPFRVRDVRKYATTSHLMIDNAGLRSMLVIPIRWHNMNIGAIFAFGKQSEVFFTENDESLAELLSIQTAGAFESTWLQQELRASLRITSLLYRLSNQIIQAENLEEAATDIAQTAHKLAKSAVTGIMLFDTNGIIAADVKVNGIGGNTETEHPMKLIEDAMETGQMIYLSQGQSAIRTCLPIQTPFRKYGAIWMDTPDDPKGNTATNPSDLQALVNQAAIALERSLLLVESRRQAAELKTAYNTLEATYDQTLASLISALDARDRETEGHSIRVSQLAVKLGETLGYSQEQLKVLERGSLLHDIGKIGISDSILHKPGPLSGAEWEIMKLHPNIGAKIVEGIPFLEDTIPLIRYHQERWDGSGYPEGLQNEQIPILARVFAVVDAFDALISDRPYRKKVSVDEALQYIREQAGILFDPNIVNTFEKMIAEDKTGMLIQE
jgi:putative nucleotidyltransferase with HDIG domain